MPSGTAIMVAAAVMISVPTMAGPMPGPCLRLAIGMSSVRNFGKSVATTLNPFDTTVASTKNRGISTSTKQSP